MLLEAPIAPTLLRLALPNVLNLAAITALITFDGFFVGKLGADALAGASLVFPWVMLVQHAAASGMGGAISSSIARSLGAGQPSRACLQASHALWFAVFLGAVTTALMLLVGPLVFRHLASSPAVLANATEYSRAAFAGVTAIWLLNILANVVRGTGDMTVPASVLLGTVVGHVILSPVLMMGYLGLPRLGVAGAGWGLAIPFAIGSLVLLVYLRRRSGTVFLALSGFKVDLSLVGGFCRVGVPGIINVAVNNSALIALTAVFSTFGTPTAIAYAAGARIEYIVIPVGFGVGTGVVALVGTNVGAAQWKRAAKVAWTGAALCAVFCGAIGVAAFVAPDVWIGLFSAHPETIAVGTRYLRIVAPSYALFGWAIGLYFACQGYGEVRVPVGANFARVVVSVGAGYACVLLRLDSWVAFLGIVGGLIVYAAGATAAVLRLQGRAREPSAQDAESQRRFA
jgi:putative MATE family efflux protein